MKIDIEITYLGEDVNVGVGASQMVVAFEFYDGNFPSSSGGGAVDSVNGKTGTVVLGANDINESSTRFWLTDVLKSAYDGAVSAIVNIYTKTETDTLLSNKVDKVSGKGLSQNDLTNALKASYDGAVSGLANKVDKVTGKGLSENDFTNALKSTYDGYASQISAKANVSEVATVLFKSITQTIITGKTLETSIYSIPLPTDGSDYIIQVYSQSQIGPIISGGVNHLLRVGTYPSPIDGATGANSIGVQTPIAVNGPAANSGFGIDRTFNFKGGASGSIVGLAPSANILTDKYSTLQFITLASKDFTTQHYLYVTFRTVNVGHIITHNQILVTLIKI